ncbi:hypothetical protein B0T10DRAFT_575590 [Thelonectria olida]|uniref:Uncharacterized protein n=1 Tax=Thelonectria olida TaxID=1576542 RepID=A0A9P8W0P5_9HYPO|nr:hypothetical protein B0T10DRAFT_575590 [Thelonectria olida]
MPADIYDEAQAAELERWSLSAPVRALGPVARYLSFLFQRYNVSFAFSGDFAAFLRGGRRGPQDVDLTVGTSMAHLEDILREEARVYFPQTHENNFVHFFVRNGREWDPDLLVAYEEPVRVTIIIEGHWGMPQGLPRGVEMLRSIPGGDPVPVINLSHHIVSILLVIEDNPDLPEWEEVLELENFVIEYLDNVAVLGELLEWYQRRWDIPSRTPSPPSLVSSEGALSEYGDSP